MTSLHGTKDMDITLCIQSMSLRKPTRRADAFLRRVLLGISILMVTVLTSSPRSSQQDANREKKISLMPLDGALCSKFGCFAKSYHI